MGISLSFLRKSFSAIILLLIISCSSTSEATRFECIDGKACAEYESNLEILQSNIMFNQNVSHEKLIELMKYFESITGIESEADTQYSGQLPPTLNDLYNWSFWYSENYNQLGN